MIIELPEEGKEKLLAALSTNDPNLLSLLEPATGTMVLAIHEGKSWWPKQRNAQQTIENICTGFHMVVRKLSERHSKRDAIQVKDEYDVQDLLEALFALEFTDIRKEEWVPSYAGASSRSDFLLKPERIVVEVKMARDGLGSKELGEQLLIDIARYSEHPQCKTLICFVYDPGGKIKNPCGIENDLNRLHGSVSVRVLIAPKGL